MMLSKEVNESKNISLNAISRITTHHSIAPSESSISDIIFPEIEGIMCQTPCSNYKLPLNIPLSNQEVTPGAPIRHLQDIVKLLVRSDISSKCIENIDADELLDNVFINWPIWNSETWELESMQHMWIPPICIAAKWASLSCLSILISKMGSYFKNLIYDGKNVLHILCSQPNAEVLLYEPSHIQPAIMRSELSLCECLDNLIYYREQILMSYSVLANDREEEMALISELFIDIGVDMQLKDNQGFTPIDYARLYRHEKVLDVFIKKQINVKTPISINKLPINFDSIETPKAGDITTSQLTIRNSNTLPTACDMDAAISIYKKRHGFRPNIKTNQDFEEICMYENNMAI